MKTLAQLHIELAIKTIKRLGNNLDLQDLRKDLEEMLNDMPMIEELFIYENSKRISSGESEIKEGK